MNRFNIEDYVTESVSILIRDYGENIQVLFSGEIDMQDPESMFLPLFERVHNSVVQAGIKEVHLNFEKLIFLNSSGIKVIIKWIQLDLILQEKDRYKFKIYANSKIPWQSNSLKLLSILSPDTIEIIIV